MNEPLIHRTLALPWLRLPACYLRRVGALLGLVIMGAVAPGASAQSCPSLDDPDANYNCPAGPTYLSPGWGNVPWAQPQYFKTIQLGDVDGDGQADMVGRDSQGLHLFMFDATTATWRPVLVNGGAAELVLTDLSDRNGWTPEQYYSTIKLVKLDASPAKLIARFGTGLQVYEFIKGAPSFGFPTGSWKLISSGGPFADSSNWNAAPYYQTLRYGFIDGGSNASVIGWGADGLSTFTWNGSGWTPQTPNPGFGDAKATDPRDLISLQLAPIDATPKAKLLTVDTGGLVAFQFVPGTGWQRQVSDPGRFFGDLNCGFPSNSCAYTLQTMILDSSGIPTVIARLPGCQPGGVVGAKFDPTLNLWISIYGEENVANGPFDDCPPGFANPENYRSIRAADIDGDGIDELIGRGPDGVLAYRWNGASKTWTQIVTNTPALSDPLWASDSSYWQTILTAKLVGKKAALLARGPTGIRTWLYNGSTFAAPRPYGGFPALDSATYTAIDTFLGLSDVRSLYTGKTDTTSTSLDSYASMLARQGTGCTTEISADPPQYMGCPPLSGTTNPTYTNTVNQLVRELWYAARVVDHYTTLQTMQAQLFTTDGSTLPAIDTNLSLPAAQDKSSVMNWLGLFDGILFFIGDLAGDDLGPAITTTADAVGLLISGIPFFDHPQMTVSLAQKYADILTTVTSMNEAAQSNVLAHKHYVLGDYGLLGSLGQLVGSQVVTLNEGGYLSVSRYAFTYWVMQSFLPTLWNQYQVTGCVNAPLEQCTPPPNGLNMQTYTGQDFTGFLPQQNPCSQVCGRFGCNTSCTWEAFPTTDDVLNLVFAPLTAQCKYSLGGTWIYPAANTKGCSLGAASDMFSNSNGWKFHVDPIRLAGPLATSISFSGATNLNDPLLAPQLHLQMVGPLSLPIDLRTAQLQVGRLLHEVGGAEELAKDQAGQEFVPFALLPQQATAELAVFETPPETSPHVVAVVRSKPGLAINFDITVDHVSVVDPENCVGTPQPITRFHTLVRLSDGGLPQPVDFSQVLDWQCVVDAQGTLKMLRAAGNPAVGLTFGQ